jgi:hypothetical protein
MKYDDAEIYFLNFENDDLPNEAGATHIGMFMAWVIIHNLVSEDLQDEAIEEIERVKSHQITGRDFVVNVCDSKLLDEEFPPVNFPVMARVAAWARTLASSNPLIRLRGVRCDRPTRRSDHRKIYRRTPGNSRRRG